MTAESLAVTVASPARAGGRRLDPLGDADQLADAGVKRNFAKVGSARPSSLLYTYGPGSIMDLPQFTIMPAGLDDWERIYARRDGGGRSIDAPRLRRAVARLLQSRDVQLRAFPWAPKPAVTSREGADLGVPARVFPQWMRCTGCDLLGPLPRFDYRNTHPFRTDEACFEHVNCPGRARRGDERSAEGRARGRGRRPAVPARYLLACTDGHLDEFPYDLWVHRGGPCPEAELPTLQMVDSTNVKGASAVIVCASCKQRRGMNEAQGEAGRAKLPVCRGRHPHLDMFAPVPANAPSGCSNSSHLMLVGASNLWFAATEAIIVMPESGEDEAQTRADRVRAALTDELLTKYRGNPAFLRDLLGQKFDVAAWSDVDLAGAVDAALAPSPTVEEQQAAVETWDPVDLLVPEWQYLQKDPLGPRHEDPASGLALSRRERGPGLPVQIRRVLAVDKLRKVNALLGFTRIDDMDRVSDLRRRLAPLVRGQTPSWTVATEDRGEGVFLQLDEAAVAAWESRVVPSALWTAHREAHQRNFYNRFSETAAAVDPDDRLRPPRYWLVHTLAHLLIREMAMTCGYSAASLSERLYGWEGAGSRPASAGFLIVTTASDSDGTLGGLVQLSEPDRLTKIVGSALRRAGRCSSDPVCARRTPSDPEDFLHGAACHCCAMASETSCERSNRFLDRRFVIDLPGEEPLGFFGPAPR